MIQTGQKKRLELLLCRRSFLKQHWWTSTHTSDFNTQAFRFNPRTEHGLSPFIRTRNSWSSVRACGKMKDWWWWWWPSFCLLRSGNEEKLMALLTPLNVNCHASDGRKVNELLVEPVWLADPRFGAWQAMTPVVSSGLWGRLLMGFYCL